MTKTNRIIDRDLGYKDIVDNLESLDGKHIVEIGVPETSKDYKDGPNQVLVASANEFGTDTIPERSFLRSTMDEKSREYAQLFHRLIGRVVDNKITVGHALDRLGLTAVSDVQRKIVQLDDPPNSEITIKLKKSSNPLIDTGQLRQSIIHRVTEDE